MFGLFSKEDPNIKRNHQAQELRNKQQREEQQERRQEYQQQAQQREGYQREERRLLRKGKQGQLPLSLRR